MADLPLTVTLEDAKNPNLLIRLLRAISDKLTKLSARIDALAQAAGPSKVPSFTQIRDQLSATGSAPLNVLGLRGVLGDPQPAAAPRYSTVPAGQVLQSLRDTQLITVLNTPGYDLYTVIGGNPNSLFKLIGGATGGTMMTTNTVQTVTAAKTFSALVTLSAGLVVTTINASGDINGANLTTTGKLTSTTASFGLETAGTNPYTITGTGVFVGKTVAGASTINMPPSPATGDIYVIVDVAGTAGTNTITVAGNGHNIDGAASTTITTNYGVLRVLYTGSIWKTW